MGGDFNCTLNDTLDRSSPTGRAPTQKATMISSLLTQYGLHDVWREHHPDERGYTHYTVATGLRTRLDFFLVSDEAIPLCFRSHILDRLLSDHAPCSLTLGFRRQNAPVSTWRLCSEALTDQVYRTEVSRAIREYFEMNTGSVKSAETLWEAFKVVIRGHCMGLSISIPRLLNRTLLTLETEIADLQGASHAPVREAELLRPLLERYGEAQGRLTTISGGISTHTTHVQADKAGHLLARLVNAERASSAITAIVDKQGQVHREQEKINQVFRDYYHTLYTQEPAMEEDRMIGLLDPLNIVALTSEERLSLETPITVEEVKTAIGSLRGGKSPGLDGLPAEFYKSFVELLAPVLLTVYNEALKVGALPTSMREALIVLLLKPGKDPTLCDSYRPISLLNIDAKILGSILASRMSTVTPALIHSDQCGFLPGRRTTHNLRRLFYILDEVAGWGGNFAVASLDASKAFDSVNWEFLFLTLRKMGFGGIMLEWIKLLYTRPVARVRTGRVISSAFRLERGTRQGCPLSPQLFAVAIEPMAQLIRERHVAQGIRVHGQTHNISLYADDVLLYMTDPEISWPLLLETILWVGSASGFDINLAKSSILPLGDLGRRQHAELPCISLDWVSTSFKYLGIEIGYSMDQLYALNYDPAIEKLKRCIQFWSTLPLSPVGRMALVKMVVLPRFLYLFQSIPMMLPGTFFDLLHALLSGLVWGSGRRRIALKTLQRPPIEGGMSFPNFQHYYWAAQIQYATYWISSDLSAERQLLSPGMPMPLESALLTVPRASDSDSVLSSTVRKAWLQMCRNLRLTGLYSPDAPLQMFPAFTSSDVAFQLQHWQEKGCTLFKHLYMDGRMIPFDSLCQEFDLPPSFFLQYLALRQKCKSMWGDATMEPPTTPVLQTLLDLRFGGQHISRLVEMIRQAVPQGVLKARLDWEVDVGMEFGEPDWVVMCEYVKKVSRNARFQQIQLYILHRSYLTPARLHAMYPGSSHQCPRCQASNAGLLHMFWSCPILTEFWSQVRGCVNDVTEREWGTTPQLWLLGLFRPRGPIKAAYRLFSLAAILAKREIARHWKSMRGPVFLVWRGELVRWGQAETLAQAGDRRLTGAGNVNTLLWNTIMARLLYGNVDDSVEGAEDE